MDECVFCKIISGKLPTKLEHEDSFCVAFRDIHPQSPFHMLVVPKKHFMSVEDGGDAEILGQLMKGVGEVIKKFEVKDYKLVINGGNLQEIKHLHLHIMSERGL